MKKRAHNTHRQKQQTRKGFRRLRAFVSISLSLVFIAMGIVTLWLATIPMPDLGSLENRRVVQSTKIYDRTGEVLLFDTGSEVKRKLIKLSDISPYITSATIAIEDANFYNNIGIEPLSIIRAVLANVLSVGYEQGASTITQQVIKNSLLTSDKTLTRKIKEWVLAVRLTRMMPKDTILETYLNDAPYGGTIYGVEEAAQRFFNKTSKDVTLAEAAYLAALPQAPSFYSPYGNNKDALDRRQKIVLSRMKDLGMITDDELSVASKELVTFSSSGVGNIKAPHFVIMVRDYLVRKYGEDVVQNGGLRVITTLDYDIQKVGEETVGRFAPTLEENFNATNAALVAIDPKSGDILTMVGSRDYFDKKIDGNFNITLAKRQPGSTFKPFVYSALFKKGYTPETVLFDVETEFSTMCSVDGKPKNPSADPKKVCYSPEEYDGIFEGPMTIQKALAHSRNIPAVKALYLAGMSDSLKVARDMGITSLTDPARYGLTLVLGGGEVSLLELTAAYGTYANDGIFNPYRFILEVYDKNNKMIEKGPSYSKRVLDPEISRQITNILSDRSSRMTSLVPIGDSIGRPVAIKTGTTNDYRDVWTLGYTPDLVVGAWAGNNDNSPLQKNVAGLIISPLWGAFTSRIAVNFPPSSFPEVAAATSSNIKPVLRGVWWGGVSYWIDTISNKLATELTPKETRKEVIFNEVHTILHWLNKDDPHGEKPLNPKDDPQYEYWEYGVRKWVEQYKKQYPTFVEVTEYRIPTQTDDVHTENNIPKISITNPKDDTVVGEGGSLNVSIQYDGKYPAMKSDVYINNKFIMTITNNPLTFSFIPSDTISLSEDNVLAVTVYDSVYNRGTATTSFQAGINQ